MDAIKDEFLYTVTHELRTPLTSIRALSEILYDNPDLPITDQQQYLEAVVKETVRLSHLITQVLNLERYESGRARLNIAELSVETMLQDAIAGIEPIAQEKQIQIQTKLAPLALIQGDRDLLAQVFTNLLSNAVKFAKTHIQVMAIQEADWLHIVVTDDGAGIDPEVHELIFDKFFQAKNQTLKKPEGSGLGLAISRRITEMHRGKIWVDSEPGKGASFHVQLPVLLND
ncbi:MAG: sensor histidine kinase [Chitinophagaceae bacterium]